MLVHDLFWTSVSKRILESNILLRSLFTFSVTSNYDVMTFKIIIIVYVIKLINDYTLTQ